MDRLRDEAGRGVGIGERKLEERGGQVSPKPNPCLELQSSWYGT